MFDSRRRSKPSRNLDKCRPQLRPIRTARVARILLLLPHFVQTHAKLVHAVAHISSQDTEVYLAKFAFSPRAACHLNASFAAHDRAYFDSHKHELTLALYSDTAWPAYVDALRRGSLCAERLRLASWRVKVEPDAGSLATFHVAAEIAPPKLRAHYWYAVVMDCYLEEYDAHPPPLHYNLTLLNGGSHLPADEAGMPALNAVALLAMAAYGAFYGVLMRRQYAQQGQGHLITLLFAFAYALQVASVFFELLHLRRYEADGRGLRWRHTWFAADYAAALAQTLSELVISMLLIALAFGWTLGLGAERLTGVAGELLEGVRRPGKLLRGLRSTSACALGSLASVQLVLHAYGRTFEEDFNHFHDLEHWPGLMLVGIRVALAGLFVWALQSSLNASLADEDVASFLRRLRLHGTCWFLASPLLVLVAAALPPYKRHPVVAGGTLLLQSVALGLLSSLFLRDSEFYKISSLSQLGFSLDASFERSSGRPQKMAVD